MKILLFSLILLLFPLESLSRTFNPLVMESEQIKLDDSLPIILIGDQFLYYQQQGTERQLWVYSLNDQSKSKIHDYAPSTELSGEAMKRVGNSVIFVNNSNELWVTDLTVSGTQLVGSYEFVSSASEVVQGLYFTTVVVQTPSGSTYNILSTDGENTTLYPVDTSVLPEALCAFSENNVLLAENRTILHWTGGSVVDRSDVIDADSAVATSDLRPSFQVNDRCYLETFNHVSREYDYLIYAADGSIEMASQNPLFEGFSRLFSINDTLFAFIVYDLVKFDQAVSAVEKTLDLQVLTSGAAISPRTARVSSSGLIIDTECPDCDVTGTETSYAISANLELIDQYDPSQFNGRLFSHNNINSMWVESLSDENSYQLKFADGITLGSRSLVVNEVIVDTEQSDHVLLDGRDEASGLRAIYSVDEVPDIGPQINGPWYNPNYHNQGFNFYRGIRANGSHYLNVTGYFHNQGAPFWFAGVGEIEFPQKTIDVRLFDYDGIGFLEPEEVPNRNDLGTLTLQFTQCDQVKATLSTVLGSVAIDLVRIDDVIYNDYCVAESSLSR